MDVALTGCPFSCSVQRRRMADQLRGAAMTQEEKRGETAKNISHADEISDAELDKVSGGILIDTTDAILIDTTDAGVKPGNKIGTFIPKVGK